MLIVSKDESVIVNFNNLEAIEIGNVEENQGKGIIYARLASDYFYEIGEYKTEERAKEVLREIMIATSIKQIDKKRVTKDEFDMYMKAIQFNIYEMPKE